MSWRGCSQGRVRYPILYGAGCRAWFLSFFFGNFTILTLSSFMVRHTIVLPHFFFLIASIGSFLPLPPFFLSSTLCYSSLVFTSPFFLAFRLSLLCLTIHCSVVAWILFFKQEMRGVEKSGLSYIQGVLLWVILP